MTTVPVTKATLAAGTQYAVEENGKLSAKRSLAVDTDVEPLTASDCFHVYALADGTFIYVEPKDEVVETASRRRVTPSAA